MLSGCVLELPPPEFDQLTRLAQEGGGQVVLKLSGMLLMGPGPCCCVGAERCRVVVEAHVGGQRVCWTYQLCCREIGSGTSGLLCNGPGCNLHV